MSTNPVTAFDFSVALDQLTSASQLVKLVENNAKPIFTFGAEIEKYWSKSLLDVPGGTAFSLGLSESASWKSKDTGIGFGLNASSTCKLEVISGGNPVIEYVPDITDVSSGTKSSLPASYDGAYLKLSLDFDIQGTLSGSGNIGALGISGKATGGAGASLVFCHHASNETLLKDAVLETFEKLVFPLEPACATDLQPNDLGQVNFHATFTADLQLSYGIAKYNFAAPSVDTVLQSVTSAAKLSLPSVTVDIGASAKIGYSHSDDFTGIVQKLPSYDTFLYLMRAHKDDVNGQIAIAAQVNITGTTGVIPDKQKIQNAVDSVTGGKGGALVAAKTDELAQKLNSSLTGWINDVAKKGVGLSAAWDRQTSTALLFKYRISSVDPSMLKESWKDLCSGDLRGAIIAGALKPEPGSGINQQLSRSTTLEFHFFNLFAAKDVSTYFESTTVEISETGDVKFLFDIGDERDQSVNSVMQKLRFHFVASATAKDGANVDLYIELSATNSASKCRHIGAVAGYLPSTIDTNTAYNDMQTFAGTGRGTLNLICVVRPSAYSRLTCSEYIDGSAPIDQTLDEQNWDRFKDAAVRLLDLDFASFVTFATWQAYNITVTGGSIADRRSVGNFNGSGAASFWDVRHHSDTAVQLNYFCTNSSEFMDLCDDLHVLAGVARQARIPEDWNNLLQRVKGIVQRDVNTDYGMAVAAALLGLCSPQNIAYQKESGTNSLTCTLTIS